MGLVIVGTVKVLIKQDPAFVALLRDPLGVAHAGDPLPIYTGWLSHAGVLGWASSASVLAFAAARLGRRGTWSDWVLLAGGAGLSAVLCLDDMLMLHESVIPVLVGVGEAHAMVGLAAVAAIWGSMSLRALVRGSSFPVLLVSGGFLAASVVVDLGYLSGLPEDGLKLAGISCWAMWAWRTAGDSLTPCAASSTS